MASHFFFPLSNATSSCHNESQTPVLALPLAGDADVEAVAEAAPSDLAGDTALIGLAALDFEDATLSAGNGLRCPS